jgi:hypothetical protein
MAARIRTAKSKPPTLPSLDGLPKGSKKSPIRITVHIKRYSSREIRDHVNLEGSYKILVDRLVESGLLPEDDEKTVEITYEQILVRKEHCGTEITISYP